MDEPFSQVDALIAESLRAHVLDIWLAKEYRMSSIVMVSHDIKEVVYMADRIFVLTTHPGTIKTVVENTLPRPRDYRSPEFLRLVDQLHEIITGHEMPDQVPLGPAQTFLATEPIPFALPSEIIGLLEYLDARGGREDIFHISADTNREFGLMINIVKAAEMLDFVDTPKRLVALEADGLSFVRGNEQQRKALWKKKLFNFQLVHELCDKLKDAPNQELPVDQVYEILMQRLPHENYERVLETLVVWARFGDLLGYDENRQVLFLQ